MISGSTAAWPAFSLCAFTTTLDGELTSLVVDVTNQKEIYVDWLASGRRLSYNDEEVSQQHDILSVRSWMMVTRI